MSCQCTLVTPTYWIELAFTAALSSVNVVFYAFNEKYLNRVSSYWTNIVCN